MLTYPILEWCYSLVMSFPVVIFLIAIIVWITLTISKLYEIRNALFIIISVPLGAFLLCYGSKIAEKYFPFIGWCFIMIRLMIDFCIIGAIIIIIRYFMTK